MLIIRFQASDIAFNIMYFTGILHHALDCLFIGILLTVLGVGLLFFLIKGFYRNSTFTPLSLVVAFVLLILLSLQSIMLCGAVKVKSMSDDVRMAINQCLPEYWINKAVEITPAEGQELLDHVIDEYPLVGYYVDMADFKGYDTTNIADAMTDEMNSFMNKFIWKRVGWCLLFIITGAFIVIKTMDVVHAVRRSRHGGGSPNKQVSSPKHLRGSRARSRHIYGK